MEYQYGYFNSSGNEFTVTNPETPRAFDNFLWNDSVMSNVQQTGVGYMDYQIGDTESVQLFTGNGRVCDFDVFGRDNLMSRLVYIRDNDTGEYWNLNWEPVCREYTSYKCTHGMGYTDIRNLTDGIEGGFRLFVPNGSDPVELWTLSFKSDSDKTRNLSIFVYCQFQFRYKWGFDSYGDMLFRNSKLNQSENAVVLTKHPHIKPHSFLTAFLTADNTILKFDGKREAFTGLYGSLQKPKAVEEGFCSGTPGSSDATIAAVQFDITLTGGQEKKINMMLGVVSNNSGINGMKEKYLYNIEDHFNELKEHNEIILGGNKAITEDIHFNRMSNYWIKQQSALGAKWCRWGWNGYRDIVQHAMGVSSFLPSRTRDIIIQAVQRQYSDGRAVRGWNPLDTKPYSDSALWLVFTLCAYIRETADINILELDIPYIDTGSDTILNHICKALDFLENHKGSHGLCLIKFGDWNDSLTAVGSKGRGESVWLTEAYATALFEMSDLYLFLNNPKSSEEALLKRKNCLMAINSQGWDGAWYARCFDDDGDVVGGIANTEGKIFGESQAWAMISEAADSERIREVIKSCDEQLLTPIGYQLLTPVFTEENEKIGRISCMEPGICENGTIYSHVNAWFILGILKNGEVEKAYDIFERITPGYSDGEKNLKQKCPPYIFANCYYGPEHSNNAYQMEFTWITGSVAWYGKIINEYMLGVKPDYDGLIIQPAIPKSWEKYTVERSYQNAVYMINVENPQHLNCGNILLTVDGEKLEGNRIKSFSDGKKHIVTAIIT